MLKTVIGLALAFGVGAACRWFDLPAPAPPKILGALLVATMTLGYLSVDNYLAGKAKSAAPETSTTASAPDATK
jgi:XapX domain-containing protein